MKNSKSNQVGNFEKLVSFANAQGPVYNPGKASIQVAALQTLLTQAEGAIQAVNVTRVAFEQARNDRHVMLENIPKLARKIIAVLQANDAPGEALDDVKALKRKLTPQRRKVTTPGAERSSGGGQPVATGPRQIYQLDVESMIGNFSHLVMRALAEPTYSANESSLSREGMAEIVTRLQQKHHEVIDARRAWTNATQTLNSLAYSSAGIYGRAKAAKAYVESVYGLYSIPYKQLATLTFIKR